MNASIYKYLTNQNVIFHMKRILTILSVGKKLESGKKYGIVIPSSLYNKNGINTADDYVYEFYVK